MEKNIKPRHPEKVKNPINPIKKKPDWIRSKLINSKEFFTTKTVVNRSNLVTVCQEANCPNITECWSKRHATFMIMGDTCTRACAFCDVKTGKPEKLDPFEDIKIANAVKKLNLRHVVITSVDRDDLPDGGASHYATIVSKIHAAYPEVKVEVLIPDFQGTTADLDVVLSAKPDVLNHNIETVPSLYKGIRKGSLYGRSLDVLSYIKDVSPKTLTKTGIMLGLGEDHDELLTTFKDVADRGVDILTLGQYLKPSKDNHSTPNPLLCDNLSLQDKKEKKVKKIDRPTVSDILLINKILKN